MGTNSRIFICDLCCVLPFGHNAVSVRYFSDYFEKKNNTVVPLVCKGLPDSVSIIPKESRVAPFFYSRSMVASFIPPREYSFADPSDSIPLRKLRAFLFGASKIDIFRRYAKDFFLEIFRNFSVKNDDRFFFPSASYYDILGFVDACLSLDTNSRPKCHFRMIGVMETSGPWSTWAQNYQHISKALRSAGVKLGNSLSLSAETGKYAQKLMIDTGIPVSVTPYPLEREPVQRIRTPDRPFTVISPGSARDDKGFSRLRDIIAHFYILAPQANVRFLIQNLSDNSLIKNTNAHNYTARLQAIPGVKLLPGHLDNTEIDALYSEADAVIMPYDAETYRFRGSAIFMESIAYNLPIVTTSGTGFAEMVKVYGTGRLCTSNEEFAKALLEVMENTKHGNIIGKPIGALRYKKDVESAFAIIWRQ